MGEFLHLFGVIGAHLSKYGVKVLSVHSVTLPYSFELDVAVLSRLFANATNSYKFIFFLSYLDILRRRDFGVLATNWRDIVKKGPLARASEQRAAAEGDS